MAGLVGRVFRVMHRRRLASRHARASVRRANKQSPASSANATAWMAGTSLGSSPRAKGPPAMTVGGAGERRTNDRRRFATWGPRPLDQVRGHAFAGMSGGWAAVFDSPRCHARSGGHPVAGGMGVIAPSSFTGSPSLARLKPGSPGMTTVSARRLTPSRTHTSPQTRSGICPRDHTSRANRGNRASASSATGSSRRAWRRACPSAAWD
jgi:hypothetical protein